MESLKDPNKQKKVAFSNLIRSDGFTADVILMKSNEVEKTSLYEQDVNVSDLAKVLTSNDLNDATICSVDPNRGQVFTAAYGEGESHHQIRRCSAKEYYIMTGSKRHTKQETKIMSEEGVKDILLGMPTAKTANLSSYLLYVTYLLLHLDQILAFNRFLTAEKRFHLYQGVQRAREEMVNILLNGGKKYNKCRRKHTKKNRKKRKRRSSGKSLTRQPRYIRDIL